MIGKRPSFPVALGLVAIVAASFIGLARAATLPSLYVNYDSTCHFSVSTDSGTALTSGMTIPYGTYQVIVSTPIPFANGQASCNMINFGLTGPAVNLATTLADGDSSSQSVPVTLQPNSSYSASDQTLAPGTTLSFSTSGVAIGAAQTVGAASVTVYPVISGFTPASGKVGTTLTITGSALSGATAVSVDYVKASFTVVSATKITAIVPKIARSGKVRVTTPKSTAVSSTVFVLKKG